MHSEFSTLMCLVVWTFFSRKAMSSNKESQSDGINVLLLLSSVLVGLFTLAAQISLLRGRGKKRKSKKKRERKEKKKEREEAERGLWV